VHKSQGSEFNRVLLALPEAPSPLLSRALLYTAVTRAKSQVEIWGKPERLMEAVQTRPEHHSGLSERLGSAPASNTAATEPNFSRSKARGAQFGDSK